MWPKSVLTTNQLVSNHTTRLLNSRDTFSYNNPREDLRIGIIRSEFETKIIINNREVAVGRNAEWLITSPEWDLKRIESVLSNANDKYGTKFKPTASINFCACNFKGMADLT